MAVSGSQRRRSSPESPERQLPPVCGGSGIPSGRFSRIACVARPVSGRDFCRFVLAERFPKSSGLLACGSGFGGEAARWHDSARRADLRQLCLHGHGIHGFRGDSPVSSSVRRFPGPITERSETGPGDGSKPKTKLSVITRQPPLQAGTVIAILPGSFLGKYIHRFTSRASFGFEIGVLAENRHAKAKDT